MARTSVAQTSVCGVPCVLGRDSGSQRRDESCADACGLGGVMEGHRLKSVLLCALRAGQVLCAEHVVIVFRVYFSKYTNLAGAVFTLAVCAAAGGRSGALARGESRAGEFAAGDGGVSADFAGGRCATRNGGIIAGAAAHLVADCPGTGNGGGARRGGKVAQTSVCGFLSIHPGLLCGAAIQRHIHRLAISFTAKLN